MVWYAGVEYRTGGYGELNWKGRTPVIKYLVPSGFITGANPGGMYVKVSQVQLALRGLYRIKAVSDISDPNENSDLLLIEPLWFRMGCGMERAYEKLEFLTRLRHIPKVLYCSEGELLRWPGEFRERCIKVFDVVTSNTEYQSGFLHSLGIPNTYRLVDPINPYLYRLGYPQDPPLVVAGGQISDAKNSFRIFEIFELLRDEPVQTAYIGGSKLWSGQDTDVNRKLELDIEAVSDFFYGVVSRDVVSSILSRASVFVADNIHDTSAQMHCESLMSGVPSVCGAHPTYRERPGVVGCRTPSDFVDGIKLLTSDYTSPANLSYRQTLRNWSIKEFSYFAFQRQFKHLLSRLLPTQQGVSL